MQVNLQKIFDAQAELMHKYHPIEEALGYKPPHAPVDIQSRAGQDRMRQFAWWITEEVVELEQATPEEAKDELSDVLHFVVELCILAGVNAEVSVPSPLLNQFEPMVEYVDPYDIILHLGVAIHELRAKPWKQTPKPVDEVQFKGAIKEILRTVVMLTNQQAWDIEEVYFHKNQVNQTRIQTGY
jgi:dimeric dUTPase (all-alpha-NTP-PPase superfamily)